MKGFHKIASNDDVCRVFIAVKSEKIFDRMQTRVLITKVQADNIGIYLIDELERYYALILEKKHKSFSSLLPHIGYLKKTADLNQI